MYKEIISKLLSKKNLEPEEVKNLFAGIIEKKFSEIESSALLTALSMKGFSVEEIVGAVKVLMKFAKTFKATDALDNCGTGGSGLPRFNVYTAASFVLAAGGVKIAKHGNRGMSGRVGSFDILENLEIKFDYNTEETEAAFKKYGLVFLLAPNFHPAMGNVALIRKGLGFKTIFNILGPLLNPGQAENQVLGVSNLGDANVIAEALINLGRKRFMVVYGEGLDEITLCGKTKVFEYLGSSLNKYEISPEDFGLEAVEFREIAGGNLEENTRKTESILKGEENSPLSDMVALNAAAGFYLMSKEKSISDGFEKAREIISSGEAWKLILKLQEA